MCKVCVVYLIQYKREIYSHIEKHTASYIYFIEREADDLRGQKGAEFISSLAFLFLLIDFTAPQLLFIWLKVCF